MFSPQLSACVTALAVMGAMTAVAQPTIQFSVPVDTNQASLSSDMRNSSRSKKLSAGDYNAPVPVFGKFGASSSFDQLDGSAVYNSDTSANARKWKQFLDGKKNWTLMTPEEIMGVQTPENVLGIENSKDDQKLSPAEKFLARQNRQSAGMATNGLMRSDYAWSANSTADFFNRRDDQSGLLKPDGGTDFKELRGINQAYKLAPASSLSGSDQQTSFAGNNPFGLPTPAAKATSDQLESMDRFRDLLEPGSPPEKAAGASSFVATPTAGHPATTFGGSSDSLFQSPLVVNPVGHSFQPLSSDVSKPAGITPLGGITRSQTPPVKKSALQAKLPPWLSDSPKPFSNF